jgi:hypothetical protein
MNAGPVADQSPRHHTIKGLIPAAVAVTKKAAVLDIIKHYC